MSVQQYCLRWNNHQPNFISVFSSLLHNEALVDVTLAAEGRQLQAHKVVLSACSSYFQALFTANPCQHPIVILKDVQYNDLKTIVDFMYYGEVNVSTEQLPQILKTAETLKIKGLAELPDSGIVTKSERMATPSREASQIGNGSESLWGSTESQHQIQVSQIQQQRCSTSPPKIESPALRRKRLKKSDSGSGSTERYYQLQSVDATTGQVECAVQGNSNSQTSVHSRSFKEESSSTETEPTHQESSSIENIEEPSHQSTNVMKMETESVPLETPGTKSVPQITLVQSQLSGDSSSSSTAVLTHSQSVTGTSSSTTMTMGSKRGRLLIRQPRVKKDLESQVVQSGSDTPDTPECNNPIQLYTTTSPNLLSVPTQSQLIKQHSHPLLPSQSSHSSTYTFHRQLSHPVASSGGPTMVPVTFVTSSTAQSITHKSSIEHHKSLDATPSHQTQQNPLVVIIPDTSTGFISQAKTDGTSTPESHTSTPTSGLLNVGSSGSHKLKPEEFTRSISSPLSSTTSRELLSLENTTRSSHCPVVRPGPALGCNYCWNTIDAHGRILRRKTKYHCPECQTNLCIVPCFQEYHERWQSENLPTSTEPPALKSSNRHQYAKSGSM